MTSGLKKNFSHEVWPQRFSQFVFWYLQTSSLRVRCWHGLCPWQTPAERSTRSPLTVFVGGDVTWFEGYSSLIILTFTGEYVSIQWGHLLLRELHFFLLIVVRASLCGINLNYNTSRERRCVSVRPADCFYGRNDSLRGLCDVQTALHRENSLKHNREEDEEHEQSWRT